MTVTKVKKQKTPRTRTASPGAKRPSEGKTANWSVLAGGALLIALAVVMGALLFGARGETATIWVADADLPAGHVLTGDDLGTLIVPANTNIRGTTTNIDVEGRVLALPIVRGASISKGVLLANGDTFESGDQLVEVGIKLLPGDVPPFISEGDSVSLVEVPSTNGRDLDPLLEDPVEAVVVGVLGDIAVNASSGIQITVAVDADLGPMVTQSAAQERLAVFVTGRG